MEVTEAPSVHRATEFVCQFYQLKYKTFIPKQLSRVCTPHLRRSLCRRHLRDIVRYLRPLRDIVRYLRPLRDSVCLLYKTFSLSLHISEESQFIPMLFFFVNYFRTVQKQYMLFWLLKDTQLACKRCPLSPLLTPF